MVPDDLKFGYEGGQLFSEDSPIARSIRNALPGWASNPVAGDNPRRIYWNVENDKEKRQFEADIRRMWQNITVTVDLGNGITDVVSRESYDAAKAKFQAYCDRSPGDRFTNPDSEIIGCIASGIERHGVRDDHIRRLIGGCVQY